MVYNDNSNYGSGEDLRECEAMRKIFVGGLNRQSQDDDFKAMFSQFGEIIDNIIIKDQNTKTSRGFGFITYATSDCVEKCFQGRPHILDGKTLDTKRAIPREQNTSNDHQRTKKLFIGGLAPDTTPEEITNYVESRHPRDYGYIDKVDILKDNATGKNKSFGFLYCDSEDFADRLHICEPHFQLNGRNMSIKKAEPKNEGGGPNRGRGGRGGGRGRGGYGGGNQGGQQGGYNAGGFGGGQGYNQGYGNQGYGNQGGFGGNQGGDYGGNYGGGYNQQQQQYSTSYPNQTQSYGGGYNAGGANNYSSGRGGSRGGAGGGNRYAPY